MLSQTSVFTKLVRDYMGPAPLTAQRDDPVADVLSRMRDQSADSVVIIDVASRPEGILTEQDISRRVVFAEDRQAPVARFMSVPVRAIGDREYVYRAIAEMRRHGLRHMPVIDGESRPVGILHLHQALAVAAAQMMEQIEMLTHFESVAGMSQTKSAQIQVATQLMDDAVPAPAIQGLITGINNDLYRRIVDLCIRDMAAAGHGPPPVPFDVIVMGSGGRGESYLYPDQDNGFILADYPDDAHIRIDPWFIELATRMTDALNEVGFPYCKGFVMATNPLWRKSISQWEMQVSHWVQRGAGMVLRLADIFFDFVPVWGEGELTARLRTHVTDVSRKAFFLRELFKFDQEQEVALNLFNRLITDRLPGPNKGKVNLKLTGTLPLVAGVRMAALANGVPHTSTLQRIDTLHENGFLNHDEQGYLSGAYRHITGLLLRQQLRDYNAGVKVSNHIAIKDMTRRERDMLIDGFKAIKQFRTRLRVELTGEMF